MTSLIVIYILALSVFGFGLSRLVSRNDIADIIWGPSFTLLCWIVLFWSGISLWGVILTTLISIWGIRLGIHIFFRHRRSPEDARYQKWSGRPALAFIQIFLLQAILAAIICSPALSGITKGVNSVNVLSIVGLCLWLGGFIFESVADYQLRSFLHNPNNRGRLIDTGLWRYSRHPNYFGEITMWWSIWIISLSVGGSFLAIIGPITITYLITKVSGIPLLEKSLSKNPDWNSYKAKTSILVPLPPKQVQIIH